LRNAGTFSEELLEKILRGVSAQTYADTVLNAAHAVGVSPTAISQKLVELTAAKLKMFQERSLKDVTPFARFLDTIHRGGEAFVVALGVDVSGEKMALGLWQDSSENHEICEARFRDLEHRGLALARRILFVTDGGSGLIKALRAWFGKKLVHQRCAIHKSRNLQRHLAKPYRPEAHRRLMTALEQTSYADARRMLRELEAWLRTKNESAAESLVEAFEELLALHQGQVPPLLRKTLLSTNPIESMFSLVRHSERNIKRTRGSRMLQRWLGTVLLACEGRFRRVKGYAAMHRLLELSR
jgi:transposase-like protein